MIRHDKHNLFPQFPLNTGLVLLPHADVRWAVAQLEVSDPLIEVDNDDFGYVRHLTTTAPEGLEKSASFYNGNPRACADRLLKAAAIRKAFGLRYLDVRFSRVIDVPAFGYTVEYRQFLKVKGSNRVVPVRGGFLHVNMDGSGRIFKVTSTLRRGRKPSRPAKIISAAEAKRIAVAAHGAPVCQSVECQLVYSSHDTSKKDPTKTLKQLRLDPTYEILITSCNPRKVVQYLVDGTTGKVVYVENKLHYADVPCRAFLRVPDYKTPMPEQVRDHHLSNLPDPKVLANHRYSPVVVIKNGKEVQVEALPDGTFNYEPDSPEFEAVTVFVALNEEDEFFEANGGVTGGDTFKLVVRDPSVQDNAYCDYENREIHIGVGSGLDNGGLYTYVGYDTGVEEHENGHRWVFRQTPGKDMPGTQGAGGNEATGDYCDIVCEYRRGLLYGHLYGHTLTVDDVKGDPRIIGLLALYPDGIRKQRNTKTVQKDGGTGEPHALGEIVGGAMCDSLEVIVTDPQWSLADGINNGAKLLMAALALLPSHKVTFADICRAFITADQVKFGGSHRKAIETDFGNHGIKLGSKADDLLPIKLPGSKA